MGVDPLYLAKLRLMRGNSITIEQKGNFPDAILAKAGQGWEVVLHRMEHYFREMLDRLTS